MSNWVKRYKIYGYNGLDLKKGRHSKEQPLKKSIISSELTPPEKEELIRLRAAIVKEIREDLFDKIQNLPLKASSKGMR